ncbi:MAG: ATP-binding cassette domain-containing protein [Bdellovibrionales bacterium]
MKIETLRFEGVSYQHPGHDPILFNADFEFPSSQVCWVQSEEGEGKSTLLQILAALQGPQTGSYFVNDQDTKDMTFEDFLPYRLKIGYSFDYGGLISNQSLRDNLLLPLRYHKLLTPEAAESRVDEWIRRFDFTKHALERPAHVPGRLRKLTCLLRAVVHHPDLLIMDDPTVGLGAETSEEFQLLIRELRSEGHLGHIFLSTYDEKFVRPFQPKLIHLSEGQLFLSAVDGGSNVVNL